jgi:hypothetical protein
MHILLLLFVLWSKPVMLTKKFWPKDCNLKSGVRIYAGFIFWPVGTILSPSVVIVTVTGHPRPGMVGAPRTPSAHSHQQKLDEI